MPSARLSDVEEIPDWYLHRRLARPLVRLLLPTPVTPGQITLLSAATGVLAGVSLVLGIDRPALRLVSAGLLLGSTVLDCLDGQLARARNTMSARGMALDTTADILVGLSMVLAATYAVVRFRESPRSWILAPVVLASYVAHCFFFDVIKERYLANHRIEYASSKAVQADRADQNRRTTAHGGHGGEGALQALFDLYWWAAGPIIRRARSGGLSRAYVRAWTLLGPGTHMMCLYVAAAASYIWPPALYVCLLVFSALMNLIMTALFLANPSQVG